MNWILAGLAVLAVGALGTMSAAPRRKRRPPPRLVSIILHRSRPAGLSEAQVCAACKRALGITVTARRVKVDKQSTRFDVMSDEIPPVTIVDSSCAYTGERSLEDDASRMEHLGVRKAFSRAAAWVSVDALDVPARSTRRQIDMIYAGLLAPIAAELLDKHCVLRHPGTDNLVALPGPLTRRLLREGRLDELFGDADVNAPMLRVAADYEAIAKAMGEAKRRLPELIAAWEELGSKTSALIKCRFPQEGSPDNSKIEYMWLSVQGYVNGSFSAKVENHPLNPDAPRKGATVEVKSGAIVDWAYLDGSGKPVGMFVEPLLAKRAH